MKWGVKLFLLRTYRRWLPETTNYSVIKRLRQSHFFKVPAVITMFPRIVSPLELFPRNDSIYEVKNCHNTETIWKFPHFSHSKKNIFRGNYSRKYGISIIAMQTHMGRNNVAISKIKSLWSETIYIFSTYLVQQLFCLFYQSKPNAAQNSFLY